MAIATDLHIVTGKGGTGKTTMAGSLALRLATAGRKVLICEVEGRQGIAQLFDVAPLEYHEQRIATGMGGGEVHAIAIDPEAALMEYLSTFYRMGRAGKALDRFGVIDFATTIAPGVRDVLLTGKVYEAARRTQHGAFRYDAVVMDAPPTGRIGRFLNVNSEVAGLARVGPIRNQADSIMAMMRSKSTRVHMVTLPEEMPVQETSDAIAQLTQTDLRIGHVLVNMMRSNLLSASTKEALAHTSPQVGLQHVLHAHGLDPDAASSLWHAASVHEQRLELQDRQRALVGEAHSRVAELAHISDGVDVGRLYEFAETLAGQGVP